jgi:hypothetical protein
LLSSPSSSAPSDKCSSSSAKCSSSSSKSSYSSNQRQDQRQDQQDKDPNGPSGTTESEKDYCALKTGGDKLSHVDLSYVCLSTVQLPPTSPHALPPSPSLIACPLTLSLTPDPPLLIESDSPEPLRQIQWQSGGPGVTYPIQPHLERRPEFEGRLHDSHTQYGGHKP